MGIENYVATTGELAQELASSLNKEALVGLRAELATMGRGGWSAWISENRKLATAYLGATPSERLRRKMFRLPPAEHRKLVLAATALALEAHVLLQAIDLYQLEPGGSYREMAASAATACRDVQAALPCLWPFDEPPPWPE